MSKSTKSVNDFRARQAAGGGTALYTPIDAEATAAIEIIIYRQMCSKRCAVEQALKRFAAELTRKR